MHPRNAKTTPRHTLLPGSPRGDLTIAKDSPLPAPSLRRMKRRTASVAQYETEAPHDAHFNSLPHCLHMDRRRRTCDRLCRPCASRHRARAHLHGARHRIPRRTSGRGRRFFCAGSRRLPSRQPPPAPGFRLACLDPGPTRPLHWSPVSARPGLTPRLTAPSQNSLRTQPSFSISAASSLPHRLIPPFQSHSGSTLQHHIV